mgnify:CR=1 FL=1
MKSVMSVCLFLILLIFTGGLIEILNINLILAIVIFLLLTVINLILSVLLYQFLKKHESDFLPPIKRNTIFVFILILVVGIFSYKYFSTYQEMTLAKVLDIENDPFISVVLINSDDTSQIIEIDDNDFLILFSNLLNEYRVKRVNEVTIGPEALDNLVLNGLKSNGKQLFFIITSSFVQVGTKFYEVINGPINITETKELLNQYSYESIS